jgi:predicted DNA-binding protein (MmcQ/YjbR family)
VDLNERIAAMRAMLDAMPAATATPVMAARGASPVALMYKIMGKLFAILPMRGGAYVIVKCDPHLVEVLREQYAGIGHRSHLDRRYWISVELDQDVPYEEAERLVAQSYDLIRAGLTRKQRAELEALTS